MVDTPTHVQADGSPYYAEFVDDTRQGMWAIGSENHERYLLLGIEKSQALFGLMLLDNEGLGKVDDFGDMQYELSSALAPVECTVCEKHFMSAQLHEGVCPADQS